MKVYDKEIYNKQENIRMTIILVVVFLLGFFVGYYASSFKGIEKENIKAANNTIIEIENNI